MFCPLKNWKQISIFCALFMQCYFLNLIYYLIIITYSFAIVQLFVKIHLKSNIYCLESFEIQRAER